MSWSDIASKASSLDSTGKIASAVSAVATAKSSVDKISSKAESLKAKMNSVTDKIDSSATVDKIKDMESDRHFKKLSDDVGISYDESSDTFSISSGTMDASAAKELKKYFKDSDGKYDNSHIVIGKDVKFDSDGFFGKDAHFDFKCASMDIQSQDIKDASHMFDGADISNITVASQPQLEKADGMFKDCKASSVNIGTIPACIDMDDVKSGCSADFTTGVSDRGSEFDDLTDTGAVSEDTVQAGQT